jgi:hypothetical protein
MRYNAQVHVAHSSLQQVISKVNTRRRQSAGQDCHVESATVTVVASSVPRGHVIVVVQDASFHVVPRGCGELTVGARYTMHLC